MNTTLKRMWQEDEGILSFDWVLLVTIVVFGLISGVAVVRDAIIDEFGDMSEATLNIDQSYTYPGVNEPNMGGDGTITVYGSSYSDTPNVYADCGRATGA